MSVVITLEDLQAYAEVDYIIKHMNQKYIDKIPKKLLRFFEEMKDPNYIVNINPYVPLQNQNLKEYALEIIALLHLKYWCENEQRKQELYDIMLSNQELLQEKIMKKHNIDNLFDEEYDEGEFAYSTNEQKYAHFTLNNSDIQDYTDIEHEENLPSEENIVEKKSFFQKIKEKILKLLKKK